MTFFVRNKIPLLLLMLGLLIFANTMDSQLLFSWDDNRYLAENPLVQGFQIGKIFTEAYFGSYIPVTLFSYALEHHFWGLDPTGYHVVNVVLHAINGVLVYLFLFLLTGQRAAAIIGAILFIVHPVQVESVAWVAQRKNLLSMCFFLLAFISHIYSRQKDAVEWLWAAWLFFLLSVLSKPAVVGAPILFMAYDCFWARLPLRRTISRATVPLAIAVFGAVAIMVTSAQVGGIKAFWGGSRWAATQLTFLTTWENLVAFIYPADLSPHYIYFQTAIQGNWRVWAGLFILIGFTAISLYSLWKFIRHKTRPPMAFFLYLWVAAFMLPVSNIVPIAIQRSDRHLYFPSVLLFLMVGLLWNRLWQRYQAANQRHVLVGGIVAATLLFSVTTCKQNQIWTDSGALWTHHLQRFPKDDLAVSNLAYFYFRTQQYPQAKQVYMELARMTPQNFKPYLFMGLMADKEEDYRNAIRYLRQAMPLVNDGLIDSLRGKLLETYSKAIAEAKRQGLMGEAIDYYGEVIEMLPNNRSVYYELGEAYQEKGDTDAAMAAYQNAIKISPGFYAAAYTSLGFQILNQGRLDEAESIFVEALTKEPNASAASGRCKVLAAKGDTAKALEACYLAVGLAPDSAKYTDQLVQTLLRSYGPDQASASVTGRLTDTPGLLHQVSGAIHEALGQHRLAIEDFRKSGSTLSLLKLGEAALAIKDYKIADDAFTRILNDHKAQPEATGGRCLALHHMGDFNGAEAFCQQAVKDSPRDGRYLIAYADLLTADDRANQALDFYRRAFENGDPQAALKLAEGYAQLGRTARANGLPGDELKALHQAVAVAPQKKELHNAIGEILIQQRRYPEALRALDAALKIDPEYTEARTNKDIAAQALGQNEIVRSALLHANP